MTLADMFLREMAPSGVVPWQLIVLRLAGSLLLSGLIGFERESRDRPAGLRTHMLVALASTGYCIIMMELVGRDYGDHVKMDPIRVVEAVTSGVAFLAAGLIVFARGQVRGLTTGASLWLAASVGVAAGLGLWLLAVSMTLVSLVIMRLLRRVEHRLKNPGDGVSD